MISAFSRRWHEIEPLIDQLFDVPAADRAAWLRLHCADATLRVLVEQALDDAPGVEALERGMAQWLPALVEPPADALPLIDGYRVLRFVGAGGMASVFEAERDLPGGPQTVALKLLRIDVHDSSERQRFLHEQRILARLRHPHIAQLLDAGFSPTGTPYLALEFVDGDDIVSYATARPLPMRERLALFIDVCGAVGHAHRNLIVHRDIKPNNVLVGTDGRVKLVDFGIAKLLTGESERTQTEARRLTRAYAAPEQLAGDAATTAIDVYALGVLLGELAGGPSLRRTEHDAGLDGPVSDEHALRRQLGADLQAIVGMATRSDPARRYASVEALAADVRRHLDGKPLHARPDTLAYRATRFARRHAWSVSLGFVAIALLAATTVAGLHEARLARQAASEARAHAAAAENEARRANAMKGFLEGLFDSAAHGTEQNETADELLARGRERADRDFAMQPALRVEMLALVGDLERRSGHPERARQPLEEAADLARTQFGAADRRSLHIEYLLAKEADELGSVRPAAARLRRAIDAYDAGSPRDTPEEVQALAWLAGLDERIGDSTSAIGIGERDLAMARRVLPGDSPALTEAVLNLGWIDMDAGRASRAEPLLREALARRRTQLGNRHADVADTLAILSSALVRLGQYGEAEQRMREAIAIDAAAYTHPNAHTAWHFNDLAIVLGLEDRLDEAQAFYLKSLAIDQALAPSTSLNEAATLANMARLHFRQGDHAAAESGLRRAIALKQQRLGADYPDNGRSYDRASLAEILVANGKLDDARDQIAAALAEARQRHRAAHPDTAFALSVQAQWLQAAGRVDEAAASAEQAVAMYDALGDPRSDKSIRARLRYGDLLHALGRDAEAAVQIDAARKAAGDIRPTVAPLTALASADLAQVMLAHGDPQTASRLRATATALLAQAPRASNIDRDAAEQLLRNPQAAAADTGSNRHSPIRDVSRQP